MINHLELFMDTSLHLVKDLFLQIGLSNNSPDIESIIHNIKGFPSSTPIWEADFWTRSQADFLKESYDEDSDWVEAVDQLDALLRD